MKVFKRIMRFTLVLLVVLTGVCVMAFWAPDIPKEQLVSSYANEDSAFYTTKEGNIIHFRDQGNNESPVTLVLIHGTAASLHTWEPLVSRIKHRYRLVSLDLPGHGLTGKVSSNDYSRQVMIDAVIELMDHLGVDSASLVGNSLGGGIAWQTAIMHPTRVRALMLLAPSGAQRTTKSNSNLGFKLLGSRLGRALMKKLTPRFVIARSLKQTVVDDSIVTEAMVDRYWTLLRMQGNRQAMIDLRNSDRAPHLFQQIDQLSQPTIIVWGENDQILPSDMIRQFQTRMRHAQSLVLTNIGHLPQEEAVDTLAEGIMTFCQSYNC